MKLAALGVALAAIASPAAPAATLARDSVTSFQRWPGPDGLAVLVASRATWGVDYHSGTWRVVLMREPDGPTRFPDVANSSVECPTDLAAYVRERAAEPLAAVSLSNAVMDVAIGPDGAFVLFETYYGMGGGLGTWMGVDGHCGPARAFGAVVSELLGADERAKLDVEIAGWQGSPRTIGWKAGAWFDPQRNAVLVVENVLDRWLAFEISNAGQVLQPLAAADARAALGRLDNVRFANMAASWLGRDPDSLAELAEAVTPVLRDANRPAAVKILLLPYATTWTGVSQDLLSVSLSYAGPMAREVRMAGLTAAATNVPVDWLDSLAPELLDALWRLPIGSERVGLGAGLRRISPSVLGPLLRKRVENQGLDEWLWRGLAWIQDTGLPPRSCMDGDDLKNEFMAWAAALAGQWGAATEWFSVAHPRTACFNVPPRHSPLLPLVGWLPAPAGDPDRARLADTVRALLASPDVTRDWSPGWTELLRLAWS